MPDYDEIFRHSVEVSRLTPPRRSSSVVKSPTEFGVDLSRVVKVESSKGQAVVE
jgi:hypothetical protein